MKYNKAKLRPEEAAALEIRGLYETFGYTKFKMNRFEEYSLYASNKDFLAGDKVLTFTDLDGRLMAMKPDVTLSIIKNIEAEPKDVRQKLYYVENVYREDKGSNNFKEISQMGLEYIGNVDLEGITEVVALASETLCIINRRYVLGLSHMGFVEELLNKATSSPGGIFSPAEADPEQEHRRHSQGRHQGGNIQRKPGASCCGPHSFWRLLHDHGKSRKTGDQSCYG